MRPLVYIAAPFAAPTPELRAWNVRRACALSLLAQRMGYAPVCVHPGIAAGAYGDDDVPEDRAAGLETCVALVGACSGVWALLRDDGAPSTGTAVEIQAGYERGLSVLRTTWDQWGILAAGRGLAALWAELAEGPG